MCHHLPPFLFSIAIPVLGVKGYPSINLFAVFAARIAALISEIPASIHVWALYELDCRMPRSGSFEMFCWEHTRFSSSG